MLDFINSFLIGGVAGIVATRLMNEDIPEVLSITFGIISVFVIDKVLQLFLLTFLLELILGPTIGNMIWLFLIGTTGAAALIWANNKFQSSH